MLSLYKLSDFACDPSKRKRGSASLSGGSLRIWPQMGDPETWRKENTDMYKSTEVKSSFLNIHVKVTYMFRNRK